VDERRQQRYLEPDLFVSQRGGRWQYRDLSESPPQLLDCFDKG
jgi:hypothetical protein